MKLLTLQTMVELYGVCMGLTLDAKGFLSLLGTLKHLALNAEVFACKSTSQSEVFQVLAREIGVLAVQISSTIKELEQYSLSIAEKAVRSAATARLCERYQSSLERGVTGATQRKIDERLQVVGRGMDENMLTIRHSLEKINSALHDISRLHVHIPVIATLLNIEAHRNTNTNEDIQFNVDSLLTLKVQLSAILERVQMNTARSLLILGSTDRD